MHIAIMGRSVRPGATGVGRFAANITRSMAKEMNGGRLTVFLTQEAPQGLWNGSVREIRAPWPTPNEYARVVWEQLVVPRQVRQLGIDLYHSPNYILPLADLPCPSVVTVHDLSILRMELHRLRSHLYLSFMTKAALRRAKAVIADSEHTRRELESTFPRSAGRIEVIYGGLSPGLNHPPPAALGRFKASLEIDRPVILYVGTLEPRKNLTRLVKAFELAVERWQLPHALALVGPDGWRMESLKQAIAASPLKERILRPGYADDRALSCWYATADLLAYPSLEEGFGLPVVEAMALGTPVVTSNVSALPEVVGDAALTVDPLDVEGLAAALAEVLTRPSLAEELRSRGMARARRFTWEEAGRRHLNLFRRILAER